MATALTEDARSGLRGLHERARSGPDDDCALNNTLAAFKAAGWSYRVIGEAAGISHEMVRRRASRAEEGAPASIPVPEPEKPLDFVPLDALDPAIAEDLSRRLEEAVNGPLTSLTPSGLRTQVADLFAALHHARERGWEARTIGAATGIHPTTVKKCANIHTRTGEGDAPGYPAAPPRPRAVVRAAHPEVPLVKIPESGVEAIRTRQEAAHRNRGYGENSKAAQAYTMLLAHWYLRGVTREDLEDATGQDWEAIRRRLAYWGYMTTTRRQAIEKPGS